MAALIYSLCAVLSLGIAVLLWAHYRRTRSRLAVMKASTGPPSIGTKRIR